MTQCAPASSAETAAQCTCFQSMTSCGAWHVQLVWFFCYLLRSFTTQIFGRHIWRYLLTSKYTEALISSMRLKLSIVTQMIIAAASSR